MLPYIPYVDPMGYFNEHPGTSWTFRCFSLFFIYLDRWVKNYHLVPRKVPRILRRNALRQVFLGTAPPAAPPAQKKAPLGPEFTGPAAEEGDGAMVGWWGQQKWIEMGIYPLVNIPKTI